MKANLGHLSIIAYKVCLYKEVLQLKLFLSMICLSREGWWETGNVFIINTGKTDHRGKIITIYSDFVFACLIDSRITILIIFLQANVKNHYSYTQTGFFQSVNSACFPFQIIPLLVNLLNFKAICSVLHDTVTKHWSWCFKSKSWWSW